MFNTSIFNEPRSGIRLITETALSNYKDKNIIHLGYGQPSEPSFDKYFTSFNFLTDNLSTQYTMNAGHLELRDIFASRLKNIHGIDVGADDIFVTCGATQGLASSLGCVINPGDLVLIPDPGYPNYRTVVRHYCGIPVYYNLDPPYFMPDMDYLEDICKNKKISSMIINTPSNPTGKVFSQEIIEQIVDLCNKYCIHLISDEVYDGLIYTGSHFSPLMISDNVISLYSMSKVYNLCGIRVGFVVCKNKHFYKSMINSQEMYISCSSSIGQMMSLYVIKHGQNYIENFKSIYENKIKVATSLLGKYLNYQPDAAFYILIDISKFNTKSVDFCMKLLKDKYVVTSPGSAFGTNSDKYIRLALTQSIDDINVGIEKIIEFMEKA